MYSIQAAATKLNKFKKIKMLSGMIYLLESLIASSEDSNQLIADLRSIINIFLHQKDPITTNTALIETIHFTALALSQFHPINQQDPVSLEKIEDADRLFVSTGHQFSIKHLINYHNGREIRNDELAGNKVLLNPFTNREFHPLDMKHIQTILKEKHIVLINKSKPQSVPHPTRQHSGFFNRHIILDNIPTLLNSILPAGLAPIPYDYIAQAPN